MYRDSGGKGWIWKAMAIVVTVLLAGGLAVFWWSENREAQAMQMANAQMEQELRPLELERYRLQQELSDLRAEYDQNARGTGTLVFLFTNLDEQIYTEIYPQMEACGYTGVLSLSEDCFPGAEGCLSRKQFRELMDAGWECCLKWEEDADIDDWAAEGARLARRAGTVSPKEAYFPVDTYGTQKDEALMKKGFRTAAHHGEEGLPLIAFEAGEEMWHPGVMAWNQKDVVAMLSETIAQKGNLVFAIGRDSQTEEYASNDFAAMMKIVSDYSEAGNLNVMTLSEARDYRQGLDEGREGLTETYNGQRAEVEEQIEELEKEINAITERYESIRK